jgi:hypothetical protein
LIEVGRAACESGLNAVGFENMNEQSTRHILMIEPAVFYANPETMDTNIYQVDENSKDKNEIYKSALKEFRAFRDLLVENGVIVTTAYGHEDCPDMVFPNWASTHEGRRLVIYPMLNDNRRAERVPEIIAFLKQTYPDVIDLTPYEKQGMFLEARGSIVCDRVNRIGYVALSKRTNKELALKWADMMEYEVEIFETLADSGKPVYHTDLVMYIGSTMAGICTQNIVERDRERVLKRLKKTHEVVEFTPEQLRSFCGNSLEVLGHFNDRMLAMSEAAYRALTKDQLAVISDHFSQILYSPLPTLEKYGGGSARCMLMELY